MYKLKTLASPFTDDILEVVCQNRGVSKEKILNYNFNDIIHYSNLKNIKEAVRLFVSITKRESSEVGIVVDSDVDTRRIYEFYNSNSIHRKKL